MRKKVLAAAGIGFAMLLSACVTPRAVPPPGPGPVAPEPGPSQPPGPSVGFNQLPGWEQEDHAAALDAWRTTCNVAKDPGTAEVCRRARALGPVDEVSARTFIETWFRAEPVGYEPGLLTAYYSPTYEVRFSRTGDFTAPIRAIPSDLPTADTAPGGQAPYADRAEIEATPLAQGQVLGWMRPEELFFLQIQGSGTLVLPDGRRKRAAFAAHNGRPFVGIATPMRQRGLLAAENTSGEAIRQWLADHRGPEADAIMQLNPRYIFFRMSDDDGREPAGAAGVPLPAGRAIAIDPSRHAMGELFWIDASAPTLNGAFPVYRRLVTSLDTGGAIKGQVRADLYIGGGDQAGREAGRVKHSLRMYRLVPVSAGY